MARSSSKVQCFLQPYLLYTNRYLPYMSDKKIPHLIFECPASFPDQAVELSTKEIRTPGLELAVNKREPRPFMAMEWAIPTALAVYILKPYFEAFLKEAGKDHYNLLKGWLTKTVVSGKQIKTTIVRASQSTNKGDSGYTQSLSISVFVQTKNDRIIKFLFDDQLTDEEWEHAVAMLLDLSEEHFNSYPNDNLTGQLAELSQHRGTTYYATIDLQRKQWIITNNVLSR